MSHPERLVAAALAVTALAAVGFMAVFALGGQPQLEGVLLGLAFAGLAAGFAIWAARLTPRGPYVEEHEAMTPPAAERRAFEDELARDTRAIGRRRFLGRWLGLALGSLGLAALFPLRSLGPAPGGRLFRTAWAAGTRLVTREGAPVRAGQLTLGEVLTVYPEGHARDGDVATVLVRVDPGKLRPRPGREDWAPDGLVAYSKLCTHLGCPVGLYEQETARLFCPCHQSAFDVLGGAEPLAGPAARPLPQLPLEIGPDGELRARGDFSAPVGPEFWELP
jgi:quinol---cytochrome c reductase iron-sulfur subunit